MISKHVGKAGFLSIVQSDTNQKKHDNVAQGNLLSLDKSSEELFLIWPSEYSQSRSLPSTVVISPSEKETFHAWAASYVRSLKPFSAFIRVVDTETFDSLPATTIEPRLPEKHLGFLGLILGEAATYYAHRNSDPKNISVQASCGTLSAALTRAISLGYHPNFISREIDRNWSRARKITRQPSLPISGAQVLEPWTVLMETSPNMNGGFGSRSLPKYVTSCCKEIVRNGFLSKTSKNMLIRSYPELKVALTEMDGSLESRVIAFEEAAKKIILGFKRKKKIDSFILGLLAALLSNGLFDHYSVLLPYLSDAPDALLWYGMISGMMPNSKISNFSSGVGHRILRELSRVDGLIYPPTCDISIDELFVLSRPGVENFNISTRVSGFLSVEIVPMVNVTLKWSSRSTSLSRQLSLPVPDKILSELNKAKDDLIKALNSIDGAKGLMEPKK